MSSKWSQDQPLGTESAYSTVYLNGHGQHTSQNLNSQYTLKIDVVQIRFFQYHNDNVDSKLKNNTQALASQKQQILVFGSKTTPYQSRSCLCFINHR